MITPMTEEEYLQWIKTRSKNAADWNYKDCLRADALIKEETLKNLQARLSELNAEVCVDEYVLIMARANFGSVETDDFLQEIGAYPAWMERS